MTIDDRLLGRKITRVLKDKFTTRIGGGEFTGTLATNSEASAVGFQS